MEKVRNEADLIAKAIEAFKQITGIRVQVGRTKPGHGQPQTDVHLCFEFQNVKRCFDAEVKRWLNVNTLGHAVEQVRQLPGRPLLVTEYVNPKMAERLKQMEIPFMDTLGNAYLNAPPLFVHLNGRTPRRFPRERPTRAFVPTGLKVVFALLCNPDLANAPYRTIAQTANVALGTVGWVLTDLRTLGLVTEMGKRGRKLTRKKELLDRWVAAFPNQLRPKLLVGRYAAPDLNWWQQTRIDRFGAYWGGEVAAARLTHYLKPEQTTVYIRHKPGAFVAAQRLRIDPRGNVELLEAFWNTTCDWKDKEIVPPFLIYADLLRTGEPRNLETARMIYDEQLVGLVRED